MEAASNYMMNNPFMQMFASMAGSDNKEEGKVDKKKEKKSDKKTSKKDNYYDDNEFSMVGDLFDEYGLGDTEDEAKEIRKLMEYNNPKDDKKGKKNKSSGKNKSKNKNKDMTDYFGTSDYPLGDYLNACRDGNVEASRELFEYADIPVEDRLDAFKHKSDQEYFESLKKTDKPKTVEKEISGKKSYFNTDKVSPTVGTVRRGDEKDEESIYGDVIDIDEDVLNEDSDMEYDENGDPKIFDVFDQEHPENCVLAPWFTRQAVQEALTRDYSNIDHDTPNYQLTFFESMCDYIRGTVKYDAPILINNRYGCFMNEDYPDKLFFTVFYGPMSPVIPTSNFRDKTTHDYFMDGGSMQFKNYLKLMKDAGSDSKEISFNDIYPYLNDLNITLDLIYNRINYDRYSYNVSSDIPALSLQELMMGEMCMGLYRLGPVDKPEEECTRRDYFDRFKPELTDDEKLDVIAAARTIRAEEGGKFVKIIKDSTHKPSLLWYFDGEFETISREFDKYFSIFLPYYQYGAKEYLLCIKDIPYIMLHDGFKMKPISDHSNFFRENKEKMGAQETPEMRSARKLCPSASSFLPVHKYHMVWLSLNTFHIPAYLLIQRTARLRVTSWAAPRTHT